MIEVLAISTVNGLPAHILLNHVVVVLGPLAAILAVLCATWPAARRRLIWQVLLLAAATLVVVPLTTDSGGWLAARVGGDSPALNRHAGLGETLVYFVAALVAAVALLAALHVRQARGRRTPVAVRVLVGVLVVAAAGGTLYRTYLVGDSGARAAWGDVVSSSKP